MTLSRTRRYAITAAFAVVVLLAVNSSDVRSQRPARPKGGAEELLKPGPRPKRPDLPPSKLPLEFFKGERVALVGNSTAERMNLFGHFETLLHSRYPDKELIVRNFARPSEEVANHQRSGDYTKLDDPLFAFGADTFLCFFGFNESFQGPGGVEGFKADYEKFLDEYAKKYPRDDANSPPRFVLVSPIAFEATGDPLLPDAAAVNADLKLYADAVRAVAGKRKLAFVDLFGATDKVFAEQPGMQFTVNGCHANEAGDKVIGGLLDQALFGSPNPGAGDTAKFEKLRAAVNDKSWVHHQDYRMLNGWYVYGGRRTWDTETFPREYVKIRNMAAVRDRYTWDVAQGKPVPQTPDDANTGELIVPPTRFGQNRYSESPTGGPRILPPDDLIKSCTVPPGFEIKLFADESRFPEIAKPCQIGFDNKGRLWLSCMPSYPLWKPGDPKPNDKLVILEDTDGDGSADKSTVFYDKLHCPTGFAFFNGGVIVGDEPRILWLKDTNGDDKADEVVHVLDGWATDDTHHAVGKAEFSHGGLLHFVEGVSMSTAVETPWGPFRNRGTSGAYVVDPRTWKIRHFNTPTYGNPWCYVFNEWGQGIVGDGTTARQHWDTPLSGAQYPDRKTLNTVFDFESMRPVVGSEYLVSRHLPDDVQGQFTYACVINMNGLPRWNLSDDGAGYKGVRVRHDPANKATAFDLIKSTDKHFRPVDPQIGPDGALWFGDWANPLIGHMQYSQRDPNRDHVHGRVYRLVNKNKPLLKPVTQFGKPATELVGQFREYEWRTRERARRELQDRPAAEVLPVVKEWVAKLDPADKDYDRLLCEALWVQQGHHAVDAGLLASALKAKTADARAAAVRIAADERDRVPGAFDTLKAAVSDPHPRVRAEAVRGLSFFPTAEAATAVLAVLKMPADYWVTYTTEAALGANEAVWRASYLKGDLTRNDPAAKRMLDGVIASAKKGGQVVPYLQIAMSTDPIPAEAKNKAMQTIADMPGGSADNGRTVFRRACTSCHKVGTEGADFGPDLSGVSTRLAKLKLVESVIDPNADVDPKYLSVKIVTANDQVITGLLVSETPTEVVVFDGKEKRTVKKADFDPKDRTVLKQSSMPDGLAGAMAPVEFLDLMAFLETLKQK